MDKHFRATAEVNKDDMYPYTRGNEQHTYFTCQGAMVTRMAYIHHFHSPKRLTKGHRDPVKGSLTGDSPEALCCVFEQATLSSGGTDSIQGDKDCKLLNGT